MTIAIAGTSSGVGKTTVTLALLAYLKCRNIQIQSFKVGPDYIDPMFHEYVTGRPCRNLDPVLTSESYVQQCFARHSKGVEFALVEGVMGMFDGVGNNQLPITNYQLPIPFASTGHIARLLDLPVLLVIDCSRLSGSVAAIAHGYRSFDPKIKLAGVVLNRVGSDRHLQLLKDALEPLQIPILGVLRRQDNISIPDRHLGLVPTGELSQLDGIIDQLAHLGESCFDWEQLLPLLKSNTVGAGFSNSLSLEQTTLVNPPSSEAGFSNSLSVGETSLVNSRIRIGVARDRAFNFYYADNLDLLQQLGAELVFWSPLTDRLPEGIQGLYFGGGFPEVFAQQLAENKLARESVRHAILTGMPTYAECGGLMYLCEAIIDFENKSWSMVGILPTTAVMSGRLTLGYRQATALQDSPILGAGATVWGHEFHRSHLSEKPTKPLFEVKGYHSPVTEEGWQLHQVHASYVHLHFGARPEIAKQFLQNCLSICL
ncbi:MAG TPA: cobyrinic acid a,c-diamide synthase [Cyanobacteria bacterium UBA11369]|nr:cobyrinic acid a,c-diamide synthase [Cyanobacteria bacterium UBA11371]HBE33280.1 cobyrinic acid a,c-diamide synthase [Cyanobacteria bacterium UBA11368]HBE50951.1 cobyrinic acid a,c-diamide synthase [Cyanobacteria bacterium UBA11369]